ncbi:hypothetical protein ACJ41O_010000 [Fusarium nematophilum]
MVGYRKHAFFTSHVNGRLDGIKTSPPQPQPQPQPQPSHGFVPTGVAYGLGPHLGHTIPGLLHYYDDRREFILWALSFYSPFDISQATMVIEHRYQAKGGLYIARTPYPLVPGVPNEIAVRVTVRDNNQMIVHLAASGPMDWRIMLPPADELARFQKEAPLLYQGQRVFIEIEDSMHGQWLSAAMCLYLATLAPARRQAALQSFHQLPFDAHLRPDPAVKFKFRRSGPSKPDMMDTTESEMGWIVTRPGDPTKWWED